ncbi:TCERG1 family protein [Megaselia abdita]
MNSMPQDIGAHQIAPTFGAENFDSDSNAEQFDDFDFEDSTQRVAGSFRGRGGWGPPKFRGRGAPRGGGGGRGGFNNRNMNNGRPFDPNWNNQQPVQQQQQPSQTNGNSSEPSPATQEAPVATQELWVETKTQEGKSYYYHSTTRETTWTKPEGPNIKVMTQLELEAKAQQTVEAKPQEKPEETAQPVTEAIPQQAPPQQAFFPGGPQFGMPPPGFGQQPPPWGMPGWPGPGQMHQMPPHIPPQQDAPAKNLLLKPGVIEPQIIARAAEWSEHRAPDGRPYYFHSQRNESIWEKPQAIRDLEAARMAAHSGAPPIAPPTQITPTLMNPGFPMHAGAPFDPMAFNAMKMQNDALKASVTAATNALEKDKKPLAEVEKKKEEEKKPPPKIVDKSRPISSTPIAGTPWCVVWTGDGRVFYYNPSSKSSVWERPEELVEREDVDKAIMTPPEALQGKIADVKAAVAKVQAAVAEKQAAAAAAAAKAAAAAAAEKEDGEIIKIRSASESSVEEVPIKKSKIDIKPVKKADGTSEAAIEAEVRAAKERALVPLDQRIKQFKEMLREKDVSAFSTWEKELHKIVFDQRYLMLTSKERKQVFERYVKDRAEEERQEKRNKMRRKREDFRKALEDANLHGKSSFSDFCSKYGKDDRFRAIEKVRERESLFNEFILEVRRREKDDRINMKEKIRKDFRAMLKERSDIDRHTRWQDIKKKFENDSRYRAVDNSLLREDYFLDYLQYLKEERRKQKDKEKERKEKKSDKKDKEKKKDKRSVDRDRSADRDHSEEKKRRKDGSEGKASDYEDDEADRLKKERDRQLRAEQSIREREKEVQKTLATHMRDRDKEREHHKRDEAIRHFNALLADLVRNADHTWKEVKKQLKKDHRWELIESLEKEEREKLFTAHIFALQKKKREKFREMLDEIPNISLVSSWKDIKKQVKEDSRYLKFNNTEICEREFREYIKDKTIDAKTSFRELLQECKLITHKSLDSVKENPNHLKEIEEILKNDKRYLVLHHIAEERTEMIVMYFDELYKRGPPPPPTASESVRRK